MADQEDMTIDEWYALIDERWKELRLAVTYALKEMGEDDLCDAELEDQRGCLEELRSMLQDEGTLTAVKANGDVHNAFFSVGIRRFISLTRAHASNRGEPLCQPPPSNMKDIIAAWKQVCNKYLELRAARPDKLYEAGRIKENWASGRGYQFGMQKEGERPGRILALWPQPWNQSTSGDTGRGWTAAILAPKSRFPMIDLGAPSLDEDGRSGDTLDHEGLLDLVSLISKEDTHPGGSLNGSEMPNNPVMGSIERFRDMLAGPRVLPHEESPQSTDVVERPSTAKQFLRIGTRPGLGILLSPFARPPCGSRLSRRLPTKKSLPGSDIKAGSVVVFASNLGGSDEPDVLSVLPHSAGDSHGEVLLNEREFRDSMQTYLANREPSRTFSSWEEYDAAMSAESVAPGDDNRLTEEQVSEIVHSLLKTLNSTTL